MEAFLSTTPNGMKLAVFLQEVPIAHRTVRLSLSRGDHLKPDFLAISPNAKIPAIIDHAPADGGPPLSMFESGAILLYLAEKHDTLLPADRRARLEVLQWLFWQVGGLGPMAGQAGHFNVHAPERVPYAIDRYTRETGRLFGVLDRRLSERAFIAGDYSIADIAAYPWVVPYHGLGQSFDRFPHLQRWFETIAARPAVERAYAGVEDVYAPSQTFSAEARSILFQQS